jgi:hypothetical protein
MANVFWDDIRDILSPGVDCMANIVVSTPEGVFPVDLTDYQSVKRLHEVIGTALNAWERDAHGKWKRDANGRAIKTKAHAMPPGGPLPVGNVDTLLAWIKDGMPETPPVA